MSLIRLILQRWLECLYFLRTRGSVFLKVISLVHVCPLDITKRILLLSLSLRIFIPGQWCAHVWYKVLLFPSLTCGGERSLPQRHESSHQPR